MRIQETDTANWHVVEIVPLTAKDYRQITKQRYFFNWQKEKDYSVYQLRKTDTNDCLGLVSFSVNTTEAWIEIRLLAVSKENRGANKRYKGIAANLIAFVCREAVKRFGYAACVALEPKTELAPHYIRAYGMVRAGKRLALLGDNLMHLIKQYYE